LHDVGKDHGVDTLLYEPLITSENRFDFLHDYHKNDARAQGKCGELPKREDETKEQSKSAGVIEIVEAENTSVPLDEKITDKFTKAVRKQGFHLITLPTVDNGVTMIEMKEGYIITRILPEKNYCAFDINLWGSFHKLKSLSKALTDVLSAANWYHPTELWLVECRGSKDRWTANCPDPQLRRNDRQGRTRK
jgi:hypothetical protein